MLLRAGRRAGLHTLSLLAFGSLMVSLIAASGNGRTQIPSDEKEMWDYCRDTYGSLSRYDAKNDQCVCSPGSVFDGKR